MGVCVVDTALMAAQYNGAFAVHSSCPVCLPRVSNRIVADGLALVLTQVSQ